MKGPKATRKLLLISLPPIGRKNYDKPKNDCNALSIGLYVLIFALLNFLKCPVIAGIV